MNSIKNLQDAIEKINKHFSFLYEKGFYITDKLFDNKNFGNWIVLLQSTKCFIRFIQDRGYVNVEIAPPWVAKSLSGKEHFIDLYILVDYLNQKKLSVLSSPQSRDIDEQLENVKELLNSNLDNIVSFMNIDDYRDKEKEISKLRREAISQMYPHTKFKT